VSGAVETGRRTFIRHPTSADRAELGERARASSRLHSPWIEAPSGDEFESFMRRAARDDVLSFLVCRKKDGAIAGVANVSEIVRGNFRSGYLGYYALEPFAGRGYMSEGIRLVLRHVFRAQGLHRIEANVQPGNVASARLVERIGFRREGFSPRYLKVRGRWRDHDRWAILAEEFFPLEAERRRPVTRPPRSPRPPAPSARRLPRTDRGPGGEAVARPPR
jgi:ribosomal-protein-alanine N-acetyltransferase